MTTSRSGASPVSGPAPDCTQRVWRGRCSRVGREAPTAGSGGQTESSDRSATYAIYGLQGNSASLLTHLRCPVSFSASAGIRRDDSSKASAVPAPISEVTGGHLTRGDRSPLQIRTNSPTLLPKPTIPQTSLTRPIVTGGPRAPCADSLLGTAASPVRGVRGAKDRPRVTSAQPPCNGVLTG